MTYSELRAAVDRLLCKDQSSPETYKPIVAIGHTKDLVDTEPVVKLLDYLNSKDIKLTDFRGFLIRQKIQR
jgi:hypothetical protein